MFFLRSRRHKKLEMSLKFFVLAADSEEIYQLDTPHSPKGSGFSGVHGNKPTLGKPSISGYS
jgi:hypothetical protein